MRLRSYLIALVVVAVLPVVIFAGVMAYLSYQQQRDDLARSMMDTTRALSAALDREFLISIQSLKILAASGHLDQGRLSEFYGEMKGALAAYGRAWQNIALLDPSGQQLINLRVSFGSPLPRVGSPELLERILQSREAAISDLFPGPVTGAPSIVVGVPVLRDGQVKYLLNAGFSPARLLELLSQQKLPPGWMATIIDRNQMIVARTRDSEKFLGKPASPTFAVQAKQYREATWRGSTLEGLAVIAALRRSDFSGWTVGLAIPAAEVDAPLRRSLLLAGAGGLAILFVALGLATVFGRRIAKPIAALSHAAEALGRGEAPQIPSLPIGELNQVGRAIEDAAGRRQQAEQSLQERYRELQWLHQTSQTILASHDLKRSAAIILDVALAATCCDMGVIRLLDRTTGMLQVVVGRGYQDAENLQRHSTHPALKGSRGEILRSFARKRTIVVERVQDETGLNTFKREGVQSLIMVPVMADRDILGLLQLGTHAPRKFESSLIDFLETLGSNFGIALQKARLLEEALAGETQLRDLSRRLVETQETERRHIARELHDEIGSLLTGLKLTLAAGAGTGTDQSDNRTATAQTIIDQTLARARSLSHSLRPPMLDDLGLLAALSWHIKEFTARANIRVDFQNLDLEGRFPPEVEIAAYRIAQEALTNVARHAQVDNATVSLWADESSLGLEIQDQGVGFDQEKIRASASAAGLTGMRERVAQLGGRIEIKSEPGAGTRIAVELPLDKSQEAGSGKRIG